MINKNKNQFSTPIKKYNIFTLGVVIIYQYKNWVCWDSYKNEVKN